MIKVAAFLEPQPRPVCGGGTREAHLPTQQSKAEEQAWLPQPYGHAWWPQGHRSPPPQGAEALGRGDPEEVGRLVSEAAGAGAHRLPPDARLKKRREFLRVQRRGRRIWGRRFIYSIIGGATPRTRIGITVSRKVGNAVVRNQIKRWVREAYRQHPALFRRPIDVVITAKRDIDDFTYAAIRDELIDVITRYFETPRDAHGARRRGGGRRGDGRSGPGGDRAV